MIDEIILWHERARQMETDHDFDCQLGCHIEEFVEMMDSLVIQGANIANALDILEDFSNKLKRGEVVVTPNRKELLDSLADQVVTAVGVGVCAKMKIREAIQEVNSSNWSKFDYKGLPKFDENGKVLKGEQFRKPNLEGMY